MKNIILVILVLVFVGCSSAKPNLSSMQKRTITTRDIDGNYKLVYNSSLEILQDNDYVITSSNLEGGVIKGVKNNRETKRRFFRTVDVGRDKKEITIHLEEINAETTKTRITLHEKEEEKKADEWIIIIDDFSYDSVFYSRIFGELKNEVMRKKAIYR